MWLRPCALQRGTLHLTRSMLVLRTVTCRALEKRHALSAVQLLYVDCVARAECRFQTVAWVLCIGLSVIGVAALALVRLRAIQPLRCPAMRHAGGVSVAMV